jgi:hypothetical protein
MTKDPVEKPTDAPIQPLLEPEGAEQAKARNMRNIVLGLSLVGFVILIFVVTLVKLGGNVGNRPL